ncbi:hypothetical protein [Agrobacterium vitis]|uniref:hypothetical protein n=1 Tax=Agrobacterium vitis TaxID=373 RepID=UPI0012E83586|nr:hypothetical protein [Agrobacterium vitis]MVA24586.1 hypothetical protein [Agrobacterium vitis]
MISWQQRNVNRLSDLAGPIMAAELLDCRRDEVEMRRVTTAIACDLLDGVEGYICQSEMN